MKTKLRHSILFFALGFSLMTFSVFAQGQNGFNMQSRTSKKKIVFVPENSKIKVKLENGNELTGNLTGADSNSIYITRIGGKQKAVAIASVNKMTVFHPHGYFNLLGGLVETSFAASGSIAEFAVLIGVCTAITAGELIVDGVADIANDEHYDLQNSWKIIGPVVAK